MRNIEIKAKVSSINSLRQKIELLCGDQSERLEQEDIYFDVEGRRKKLRIFTRNYGELIEYSRENKLGPKLSEYTISKINDPKEIFEKLCKLHRVKKIIKKTRYVYMFNRTRIHLDTVEGLGGFIELEVVLSDMENENDGVTEAKKILRLLNLEDAEFIKGSYDDLLEKGSSGYLIPSFF